MDKKKLDQAIARMKGEEPPEPERSRFVRNVRVDYMDLDDGFESSVYTYVDKDGRENDAESVQAALRLFKYSPHYQNVKILSIYIVRMSDVAGNDEIIREVDRRLIEGFEQWRNQKKLAAQKNGPSKT